MAAAVLTFATVSALRVSQSPVSSSGAAATDQGSPSPAPPGNRQYLYDQTKDLTGRELVDALGLKPAEADESGLVVNCPPPGYEKAAVGAGYCIPIGDVVSNDFEAWELSMRLSGRLPSDLVVRAHRLYEAGSALLDTGDPTDRIKGMELIEEARRLQEQARREQAQGDP